MPMIGLFFYVEGKLLAHQVAPAQVEIYGDFLTSSISHDTVWHQGVGINLPVDFDYFPRGRVVYNRKERKYIVYIDRCLNMPERIAEILKAFGLTDCQHTIAFDEHYQCHRCNKDYFV